MKKLLLILTILTGVASSQDSGMILQIQNGGTTIFTGKKFARINFTSGCSFASGTVTCTAGAGSPGGANTNVQYNDSTAFGGDAGFTYNKATHNVVLTGSISATSIIGTAGGGVGNNWLCAEGTDPGTEAAGKDLLYCDSAAHAILMSLNGSAVAGNALPGMNQVNTAGSTFTLNMAAAPVATGLSLPKGAGANPTIDGNCAWDSTTHGFRCGNGTTTVRGMQSPLISGCATVGVTGSITSFIKIQGGVNCANNTEATVREKLPFAGTVTNLCVTVTNNQPAGGDLVVTFRDTTAASDSALTVTFATGTGTTTTCDNAHSATIVANNDYVLKFANASSSASATIAGISLVYNY